MTTTTTDKDYEEEVRHVDFLSVKMADTMSLCLTVWIPSDTIFIGFLVERNGVVSDDNICSDV